MIKVYPTRNVKACPITATLPETLKIEGQAYLESEDGAEVPCQLGLLHGRTTASWIDEDLKAGVPKEYKLRIAEAKGEKPHMSITKVKDDILEIHEGEELVTRYLYSYDRVRPYMYPLNAPGGVCLTEDGPRDHVHHRSFWVAHGDVNGVDCWTELRNHGYIRHKNFERLESGDVYARVVALNVWTDHGGNPLMDELRDIRIWRTIRGDRIIDFNVSFRASYGDVTLGDTKEGGLISLRVTPSMRGLSGGRIENSEGGVGEEECWGKRARWCDYSGVADSRWLGIAVMDHPRNPRHPTYWHVRAYGLFTANCLGVSIFEGNPRLRGDMEIKHGEVVGFMYRVLIHEGDAARAEIEKKYQCYIEPPRVEVVVVR